jgi:flagellar biosynthetic protein FliP
MCVVMCAGGLAALAALLRWAGPLIGYPEFKRQLPELSTVLLALWLTVVMIAWMRLRGHEWRSTLEMASTSVFALPLVLAAAWLGVIPNSRLFGLECGVACALMVVPMLFRLDHYAGSHRSHQSHAHSAHPAQQHSHHTG